MKIKLAQLNLAKDPLARLYTQPLPGRTAYQLGKIIKAVDGELVTLEDTRVNLVKTHGHQDARGGWQVGPDKLPEFNTEWEAVLAEDVDIPGDPIPLGDFGARFEATPQDMALLDWLITE